MFSFSSVFISSVFASSIMEIDEYIDVKRFQTAHKPMEMKKAFTAATVAVAADGVFHSLVLAGLCTYDKVLNLHSKHTNGCCSLSWIHR